MSDENRYQGLTVVVTGASSGFGEGTAMELVRRGANVVLAARSGAMLKELVSRSAVLSGKAFAVETDVGRRDAVNDLMREAIRAFGQVDVWINNAGAAAVGRFDITPIQDHEKVIQTDLLGTIYGSYFALKHFRERGAGVLINVASVIGKIPAPLYASYAAAKFGVVGLSDALRQELAAESVKVIRVCTVMPMAHDTEFFEHAANYTGKQAAPIPPTYDPQVTIDRLVELVVDPEDEVITGWQGSIVNFFHKLMPGPVESLMTANTKKAQLEQAPPAPITRGALHEAGQS